MDNTMYIPPIKENVPFLDRFKHFTEVGETITLLVARNEDGTVKIVRWFLEIRSYSNETITEEQYKKERDNRIRNLSDVENGIIIPELGVFPVIELFRGLDRDIPDNGLITTALWDIPQNRAKKGGYLIVLRIPDEGDARIEKIDIERYNQEKKAAEELAEKLLQKVIISIHNGIEPPGGSYHS